MSHEDHDARAELLRLREELKARPDRISGVVCLTVERDAGGLDTMTVYLTPEEVPVAVSFLMGLRSMRKPGT